MEDLNNQENVFHPQDLLKTTGWSLELFLKKLDLHYHMTLLKSLEQLAELAPHLIKFDVIEGSGFEKLAHKPNGNTELNGTQLSENVDNFYMTDAISRNSHMMAMHQTVEPTQGVQLQERCSNLDHSLIISQ